MAADRRRVRRALVGAALALGLGVSLAVVEAPTAGAVGPCYEWSSSRWENNRLVTEWHHSYLGTITSYSGRCPKAAIR